MPSSFVKDPDAKLDYYINWTAWLAGDTISGSTWVSTDGVVLSADAILGGVTRVWVDGGTQGTVAALTNHITTVAGREEDRTLLLVIREK